MTELRHFQCQSHTVQNVCDKSIPSDHVPVRLIVECPRNRQSDHPVILRWLTKHPLFDCALHEEHRNMMCGSRRWRPVRVARPDRPSWLTPRLLFGAKLLIACIALRAHRNGLASTGKPCISGELVARCIDRLGDECINFGALCNISRASREVTSVLSRKKSLALMSTRQRRHGFVQLRFKQVELGRQEPKLTIYAINGSDDAPIFVPDDAARRLCQNWSGIFRVPDYGIPAGQADTLLSFVVPALREMKWATEFSAFEEMLASKRESAPGPDGLPYSVYQSAGGIGAKFPSATYEAVLMAAAHPAGFGALCSSPIVVIPTLKAC